MQLTYTLKRKRSEKPQTVTAEAVTLAFDTQDVLAFVELSGPTSAIRAIWAELMRGRSRTASDEPDHTKIKFTYKGHDTVLKLAAKTRYLTRNLDGNIVVMHPGFDVTKRTHMMGGDLETPSLYFLDSFRHVCTTIPVLPEWSAELWRLGLEKEVIKPLISFGSYNFWYIVPDVYKDVWKEIVKEVATHGASRGNQ